MEWKEKDLEDYLWENPADLRLDCLIGRQIHVGVGIVDLLGLKKLDNELAICVVEIKRDQIDCEAVGQCSRYANVFSEYLKPLRRGLASPVVAKGLLVGTSIHSDALELCHALGYEYHEARLYVGFDMRWVVPEPISRRLPEEKIKQVGNTLVSVKRLLKKMLGVEQGDKGVGDSSGANHTQDSGLGTTVATGEGER